MEHHARTDPYIGRYAARAQGMVASEVRRALSAVTSRPEVVSLAGGMPYVSALLLNIMGNLVSELVARRDAQALQCAQRRAIPSSGNISVR